jgi:hypothetical protein
MTIQSLPTSFIDRHIGARRQADVDTMLRAVGYDSVDGLADVAVAAAGWEANASLPYGGRCRSAGRTDPLRPKNWKPTRRFVHMLHEYGSNSLIPDQQVGITGNMCAQQYDNRWPVHDATECFTSNREQEVDG